MDEINKFLNELICKEETKIFDGFKVIGTLYSPTKESYRWNNKSKFQEKLKNFDVKYCVYIKFYRNNLEKTIKPLVVGKSGSLLVNSNGCDLKFEEKVDTIQLNSKKFLNYMNNITNTCRKKNVGTKYNKDEQYFLDYIFEVKNTEYTNYSWYHEHILIKSYEVEKDALEAEKKIIKILKEKGYIIYES